MEINEITKKILGFTLILMIVISTSFSAVLLSPHSARAEGADVPTNQQFDLKAIMMKLKAFTLDHLAENIAKQILHQITISIINWINSGFQGSPAFLTNPEGFFLDAADQVTGQFLAQNGALSALCSPFKLDIRLALALDQTMSASRRYTCTLGKIVNNVQGTIDGFTNGDFSQGGWPAFISLTTEPQNNIYGSYLQAHSELLSLIGAKEGKINQDLNRGGGFMSWQKCEELSTEEQSAGFGAGLSNPSLGLANTSTADNVLAMTNNNNSTAPYRSDNVSINQKTGVAERCTTQTPGSVIAGSLQKAVDSPIVEAELADDINAVLNALVSQMISQMLNGGLAALSGGGSGSGRTSYTQQIINDIDKQNAKNNQNNSTQLSNTFDGAITSLNQYKTVYDQAVGLISGSRSQYITARTCFAGKIDNSRGWFSENSAQNYISNIDNTVAVYVDPLLTQLTTKQTSTTQQITDIQNLKNQASASSTQLQGSQFNGLRNQLPLYESGVKGAVDANTIAVTGMTDAQKDLVNAQTQAQKFNINAAAYQQACTAYPNGTNAQNLILILSNRGR